MQVPAALMSAGRVLCCTSWLVATQHAAAALPLQQLRQYPHPALPQHAHFTTSSHARAGQQQQQQEEKQQQEGVGSGQHGANVQQEAKEASKGLVAKNFDMEELWFAAVGGKLKVWSARSHPDLKGREEEVVDQVKEAYYETLKRSATGHLLSTRSRSQLKQACLAAATYQVMVKTVPGTEASAEQFICDLMGGLYAPFMLGGLKVSSWVKRLLLRQSSISQAVDTLHTIARDMEGACHCSVQPLSCGSDSEADDSAASAAPAAVQDVGSASTAPAAAAAAAADGAASQQQQQQQQQQSFDEASEHEKEDEAEAKAAAEAAAQHHGQHQWQLGASLTVDSCLYAEVLTAEGVPQLLKAFCCQHNMSWLDTYSSQGIVSQLEACIAKGDGCCRITVTPK